MAIFWDNLESRMVGGEYEDLTANLEGYWDYEKKLVGIIFLLNNIKFISRS